MVAPDIPDWIKRACALWGRQKRRIWAGKDWHGNIDGYAQSLLGRIREEREGAGQSQIQQRWPEVFTGDGLDVQRAVLQRKIRERPRIVLTFHYVWDPEWDVTAECKAALIGISRRTYFLDLRAIQEKIWGFMECNTECNSPVREITVKLISQELQKAFSSTIRTTLPPLSLEALNRPTLRRPA